MKDFADSFIFFSVIVLILGQSYIEMKKENACLKARGEMTEVVVNWWFDDTICKIINNK